MQGYAAKAPSQQPSQRMALLSGMKASAKAGGKAGTESQHKAAAAAASSSQRMAPPLGVGASTPKTKRSAQTKRRAQHGAAAGDKAQAKPAAAASSASQRMPPPLGGGRQSTENEAGRLSFVRTLCLAKSICCCKQLLDNDSADLYDGRVRAAGRDAHGADEPAPWRCAAGQGGEAAFNGLSVRMKIQTLSSYCAVLFCHIRHWSQSNGAADDDAPADCLKMCLSPSRPASGRATRCPRRGRSGQW